MTKIATSMKESGFNSVLLRTSVLSHRAAARYVAAMMQIVELTGVEAMREAFPLIKQLRPYLDASRYETLLAEMIPRGYRMFAVREDGVLQAVAGIELCVNLYHGRHVWVYDLVTDEHVRSRGVGQVLLRYIEDFGRTNGCERVSLASGLVRTNAHRFYEGRMAYERVSYVFTLVL
jgi:GNAT superfamily N-acetyltransferase